jgi:hypothetical protein
MTLIVWIVIPVAALVAIWYAVRRVEAKAYACGYAAGRQDERRSDLHKLNSVFRHAIAQGLAARCELDYLYAQARKRIDELSRW